MTEVQSPTNLKRWPTPQDYNEAIQNLEHNVVDSDLQNGQIETGPHGLPRPITGAFASVYKIRCDKRDWAVRCFLRNIPDTQSRYQQISEFVQNDDLPYTVGFDFQPEGIKIAGTSYPLLKMEWVDGDTLDNYLRAHHNQLDVAFAEKFKTMCLDLRRAGIAHGDLQHGNIIVNKGEFFLVDYDGMYVPSMKGERSNELGHRNYQHPRRADQTFSADLDNFSAWVIYASLMSLAIDKSLYERLAAGDDCLLFRRDDFTHPLNSYAFSILEHHESEEIRKVAKRLRLFCMRAPDDVPPLDTAERVPSNLPAMAVVEVPQKVIVQRKSTPHVSTVSKPEGTSATRQTTTKAAASLPTSSNKVEIELQQPIPRKVVPSVGRLISTFAILCFITFYCWAISRAQPGLALFVFFVAFFVSLLDWIGKPDRDLVEGGYATTGIIKRAWYDWFWKTYNVVYDYEQLDGVWVRDVHKKVGFFEYTNFSTGGRVTVLYNAWDSILYPCTRFKAKSP
ncbi:MAG TPA: hypothetical protein V6D22_23680 [Candidatus Obscuribacterales bacterium]